MKYDKECHFYIYHNNKKLVHIGKTTKTSKSEFKSVVTIYQCEDGNDYNLREICNKSKSNKKLYVSKDFQILREFSIKNIHSAEGVVLRINRSIQVEGAFGIIKNNYKFKRFSHRGNDKVCCEFLFVMLCYNINKLNNKFKQNRCGISLFTSQKS